MMQHHHNQPSLGQKITAVLDDVTLFEQQGARLDVTLIRALLARRRVMVLPRVESHTSTPVPDSAELVECEVILHVSLLDADADARVDSRWVGRVVAPAPEAIERAITHALEDFLFKTFLVIEQREAEQLPLFGASTTHTTPAPEPVHVVEQRVEEVIPEAPVMAETSKIRRRPQGAASDSPQAVAPEIVARAPELATALEDETPALETPAVEAAEVEARETTEVVEPAAPEAWTPPRGRTPRRADPPVIEHPLDEAPIPPGAIAVEINPTAWKAANALWRALVTAVVPPDVMELYEDALEQHHGVDSWRKVTPDQIREACHQLRKRSPMPSDRRALGEREEYILAHLPGVPESSSLERTRREIERLALEVTDEAAHETFLRVYLDRMGAPTLDKVPGRALMALVRKLRRLRDEDRFLFIHNAINTQPSA